MSHQALHSAIQMGDVAEVDILLQAGASINHLFGMKGTPLCAAVAANKAGVVQYLLRGGCDVNAKDYDGEPPLCMAIRKGHSHLAATLIKSRGVDLNKTDPITGDHPLTIAILKNDAGTARLLIEHGCDLNKRKGEESKTALHVAVTTDNLDLVRLLLDHGASLAICSSNGVSPFLNAAYLDATEIVQFILEYSLSAGKRAAYEAERLGGVYSGMTDYLLRHTSQILQDTALHVTARNGNTPLTRLLLAHGAQVNVRNTFGHTPLFLACAEAGGKHLAVVEALLAEQTIDTESVCYNKDGASPVRQRNCTALQVAISKGCTDIVGTLIRAGVSVNTQDSMGVTPLSYAFLCDRLGVAQHFLDRCPELDVHLETSTGENLLWPAVTCREPQRFVAQLVARGCSVNHQNDSGETPLHAALDASLAAVGALAASGADLDALYMDMAPLHVCAVDHLIDESKVLIFYGADMNRRNSAGQSILDTALNWENCDLELVALMLDCGCELRSERGLLGILAEQDEGEDDMPWCQSEDPELYERILEAIHTPLSLKLVCRNAIRKHYAEHSIPMKKTTDLPLPKVLLNFVQLIDDKTNISPPLF